MYKLPKARQNADDQVASGFSFVSDWWESGASFLDQSQSKVKEKQINLGILSTLSGNFSIIVV